MVAEPKPGIVRAQPAKTTFEMTCPQGNFQVRNLVHALRSAYGPSGMRAASRLWLCASKPTPYFFSAGPSHWYCIKHAQSDFMLVMIQPRPGA